MILRIAFSRQYNEYDVLVTPAAIAKAIHLIRLRSFKLLNAFTTATATTNNDNSRKATNK